MASAITFYVVLTFAVLSLVRGACTPPNGENNTDAYEWKLHFSDVVAHGVVLSAEHDPSSSRDGFSVTFQVRCIYKGAPLDETIRINQVGYNPDNCLTTNLTKDLMYIVYLKKSGNDQLVQEFKPDPADSQHLDEIVVLCDAIVTYPNGYSELHNKEECPKNEEEEDCMQRPVLQNPPDDVDDQASSSRDETTNQKSKDGQDQDKAIPDKSVEFPGSAQDDGGNGSVALTLHINAVACLVLIMIFL